MIEFAALTDPGARGGENEDVVGWDLERQIWLVADGMGGYEHGREASSLVKQTMLEEVPRTGLVDAVLKAHAAVQQAAKTSGKPMGSTIVCAQIGPQVCRIVWVGDSRAYLWRGQQLLRLTRDHSLVQAMSDMLPEAEAPSDRQPEANVVLQSLGMGDPSPSEQRIILHKGDWIMLCSDGVSGELQDQQISAILKESITVQQGAQQILSGALHHGGRDNASVVLIQFDGRPRRGILVRISNLDDAVVGTIAAMIGVLLAAAVALLAWKLRGGR
jgi:PPM family protein phosphatase